MLFKKLQKRMFKRKHTNFNKTYTVVNTFYLQFLLVSVVYACLDHVKGEKSINVS